MNIGVFSSILPFDIFNSNLILDFDKSLELIYSSFYNHYNELFLSDNFMISHGSNLESSTRLFNKDLILLAPIGYVCHR